MSRFSIGMSSLDNNQYFQKYKITKQLIEADKILQDSHKRNSESRSQNHGKQEYNDQDAIEIFRKITDRNYPVPMMLVWTAFFQSTFSDSVEKYPESIKKCGNYFLYQMNLENPIIYSFGVGNNISFDIAVQEKYQVPVYLFDPTPAVGQWIKPHLAKHPELKFESSGLYTENGQFKLYKTANPKKFNSSMYDIGHKNLYDVVEFKTLKTFLRENGHKRLDILKIDIEGMALNVLEQMMDTWIRPKQILAEFEIISIGDPISIMSRITNLIQKMKSEGYKIYNLNLLRKATVEILAVL